MTICEPQSGGNILCIRLSGLGDVVHALPALTLLREHRPLAHITWIVEERFAGLLEGHPCINELITIPRALWGRSLRNPLRWPGVMPELMDLALNLRRRRFDVSIDFQSSVKSGWLVAAAGATLRVGFAPPVSRELAHWVQNSLVTVPGGGCHRIERDLALLAPLGIPTRFEPAVLPRGEEHVRAVAHVCRGLPRPLVVMHPGTSEFAAFKRWEPERYAEVAERLIAELGAGVLVTWGPGEDALAWRLVGATAHRAVMAPRLTHLQQLGHVLSRADLLISSDTGPMHMASALGTPIVALFGPKDELETGPYSSRSEVVSAPVPCRPCTRRRCADRRCMLEISADQVYAAALRVLNGGGTVRARKGAIRRPFVADFRLGEWAGQACTAYSAPAFYRLVAALGGGAEAEPIESAGGWRERVSCTVEGETRRLLVRRWRRRDGARRGPPSLARTVRTKNYWRSALRLRRRGMPTRMPVCYMQTGPLYAREQLLMVEDMPGVQPFAAAVESRGDPVALMQSLAELIRRVHDAGHYHGDLRAENVLVDGAGRLFLDGLDKAWAAAHLPALVRDVLGGFEVRRLLRSLRGVVSERGAAGLVRTYCRRIAGDPVRLRIVRWAIGPVGVGAATDVDTADRAYGP